MVKIQMNNYLQQSFVKIAILALVFGILSCDTGMIDNLSGISIAATFHGDRINVKIFLQTETGSKLLWGQRVSQSQPGFVVPEEDFDTHLKVYSDGHLGTEWGGEAGFHNVYDGRLADLHWNATISDTQRMLLGYIPTRLIKEDAERETNTGIIELTLITPKQGNFDARLDNVQIYAQ